MIISQLLKMPVGQRTGGGFILTIKKTKKSVQLPNKKYIHTVVLFDNSGEILADFKDPTKAGYIPLIKGQQVHIIVAEIQNAESGIKLYVDQYEVVKGKPGPDYFQGFDDMPDYEAIVRGKIRMHTTCSFIRAGMNFYEIDKHKEAINKMVDFIMTGE